MPLSVNHAFVCLLPDDPVQLGAGEICPQTHWNAGHVLTGQASVGQGGTGIGSGTSGGIPFFSSAATMASTALLVTSAIVFGGGVGAAPATPLGLGTANTVLHGNASGIPSWQPVALGSDVSGNLPVGNLNGGIGASNTTFWRGDGTWATAGGAGTPGGTSGQIQYNNVGAFGGFTVSGDGTLNTGTGVLIVTKTNGAPFVASATSDTTNAANISSGFLLTARIAAGTITLAQMANISNLTILGNNSGGAAAPIALNQAQVTAMLNVFSSSLQGVVPSSGGGTSTFLRADGSWATPAGGGNVSGPGTSVINDLAVWSNVSGTQLADVTYAVVTSRLGVFTSGAQGVVPASGGGTTNFLRADGSWAAPPGSGGISGPGTTVVNDFVTWNNTLGTLVADTTPTQATALLNLFSSTLKGLAPLSGGGTVNFLRADGTWAVPPGGASSVAGSNTQVQYNNSGVFGADAGFTYGGQGVNPMVSIVIGTITTNVKGLNITGTWNAAGVTFDAPLFMNITNTASHSGSLLADFQVGGTTQFYVDKAGNINVGGASSGTIQFINNISNTLTFSSGQLAFSTSGAVEAMFGVDGGFSASQSGVEIRSGGTFCWSAGVPQSNTPDTGIWRQAAATVAIINGASLTSANAFQVYNTTDTAGGTPTNYERGVFDWTTSANTLTIGTQNGGTGTARNVTLVSAGTGITFSDGTNTPNFTILSSSRLQINNAFYSNVSMLAPFFSDNNNSDWSISRSAAKVMAVGTGSAGSTAGWLNWGGEARVTADFSVTSSTALTNVTGLSVTLQAGRTYWFESELFVTDAAAGGVQAAIAGTATATAIQYTGYTIADNAIKGKTNATALATAVGSTLTTETTGIVVRITGIITVNAAGTLTVQMAQNTSNATATTAKRGSYFIVHDMP